jgi:hypothetical protein
VTSLKLQKDIGAGWVDVVDATARIVAGNKPIFITFTQASAAQWRLLIAYPSLVPSIGVLSFGARLDVPLYMRLGWTPPTMSNDDDYTNHLSMGGAFIGRSLVARGVEGRLEFDSDTFLATFIRASWLAFIEHARQFPFFFAWDETNFPSEAAYLWADGRIDDPSYSSGIHMRASIKVRGLPT